MPKPKAPPGNELTPENEPPDPVQAVSDAIADALGVDRSAKLSLQRMNQDTKEWEHLPRIPTEDFDVETVRERFGGGEYRVRIRGKGGQFIGNVHRFVIAGDPIQPDHLADALRRRPEADNGGGRDDRMFELVLAMLARPAAPVAPAAPAFDPVALTTAIITASNAGAERLAEMVGLKRELGAAGGGEDAVARAMELLEFGMRIGRRESDGGSDPMSRLADAAKPLFAALAARTGQAPDPGAPPAPDPATQGPEKPVLAINPLVPAFEHLMKKAERGSASAEVQAEAYFDDLDGDAQDDLLDALDQAIAEAGGRDAMLVQVARMDPRVDVHMVYFRHAVDFFIQAGTEAPDEAETAAPAVEGDV